jgi:hypothetical protein
MPRLVCGGMVVSAAMGWILPGYLLVFLEFCDRLGSFGSQRPDNAWLASLTERAPHNAGIWFAHTPQIWIVTGGACFLFYLAYLARTKPSELRAMSVSLLTLLTAIWIEFTIALPIHLVVRSSRGAGGTPGVRSVTGVVFAGSRSGTWLVCCAGFPILIWAVVSSIHLLRVRADDEGAAR